MTDEEMDAYAVRLAEAATATVGDPVEAAGVLLQAGLASLVSSFPAAVVIKAFEGITADMLNGLRDYLGEKGQTRQ